MSRGVQGWSWKHAPSLRTVDNCLSNCRTYCATVSSLSQFNSGRLSGYWYKGVLGRLGLAAVQPAASPPQQQQRSLMAHFLVRHRTSTLGTRGTRSRPAVRAVLHTSAPIEKQQLWQQAVLAAMLQQHATDTAERSAYSSCAELDAQLDSVFDGLDDIFYSKGGFVIPKRERQLIDATGGSSSYGEVQAVGVDQLLKYLAMDSSSVFVDLGSGRGRAVLQVAAHSTAQRVVGLELSESRLEQAELALQQLEQQGVQLQPVEFKQADLSSCDLTDGTHFYLCSTAFGAGICRSIAERLKASPNFQVLITSRQLPTQPFLYKLAEVPCQFSYSLNGRAYIYVKSLQEAPAAVLARVWCRDGVCWLPSMSQMHLGIAVDELLTADDPSRFVDVSPCVLAGTATADDAVAAEPSSLH